MITQSNTVYTLRQNLHVNGKQKPIELQTFFITKRDEELNELLNLFKSGRTDQRIVEQELPNRVYESGFRVEWVSLTAPDGRCLNEQYTDYPWSADAKAN